MSTVSVILPTYNRAAYIKDAVESVLGQTAGDVNLIIVDDGSTDRTRDVLKPYESDSRVTCLYQDNAGVSAARNCGLAHAKGEFVAFIDSDDIWDRDKLRIQLSVMDRLPDVAMVCSDFSARNSHEYLELSHIRSYFSVLDTYRLDFRDVFPHRMNGGVSGLGEHETVYWGDIFETMLFGNIVLTSTTLFRRGVFEQTGSFDRRYPALEDYDLFLKAARSFPVAFVDKPLIMYQYSDNQLSGDRNFGRICDLMIEIFKKNVDAVRNTPLYERNRKKIRHRLGMYEAQKGYYHFMHDEMMEAGESYGRSILLDPGNMMSYVYWGFSRLPVRVTHMVRRLKSIGA